MTWMSFIIYKRQPTMIQSSLVCARGKMCVKARSLFVFIVILNSFVSEVYPARILGIFPVPSKSHQVVFRSYTHELAKKGHELIIITPEPFGTKNVGNITEIDTSAILSKLIELFNKPIQYKNRGVIINIDSIIKEDIYNVFLEIMTEEFTQPAVQELINDKQQKFDLIVVEGFFEYQLIFSEIFKAPVIMFASFMGFPETYEMVGAVGRHPLYYPHFHRMYYDNLGFWGTLKELYNEYLMYKYTMEVEKYQDYLLKKNFGPNAPTTSQLKDNVDMLFLSVHPMFANNKPTPPNVIYLHAPHIQPVKDLPQDLKTYLDNSKTGVVYVSFGTNIMPKMMDKEFLDQFLKAFAALPYDILWKFDDEGLGDIAKNIKIQKWFPQQDLLHHPNIKVFVTQGGIQSASEAIDAAVPLVGVPMGAEQFYNTQKFVDFKVGVKLDTMTLTADDLVRGVEEVIENKSYKENIERLRKIFRDQSEGPLDRAVWWTEYVLRHGGAKHLRSPAANVPWTEYYMLNYVLVILGALLSILFIILISLYCLVKKVSKLMTGVNVEKTRVKKIKLR